MTKRIDTALKDYLAGWYDGSGGFDNFPLTSTQYQRGYDAGVAARRRAEQNERRRLEPKTVPKEGV